MVSSSHSGGEVHELIHDWSISGYDFIKGYQIERFNSPAFKFYGFEWFIQFYPHGTSDNRENVAVFLIGKDLPKVEILCSYIQFSVVNQADDSKTLRPQPYYYVLSGKDTKHNHSNSGGHTNVIKSPELHDNSKGYIGTDGTLKIRLQLKISCLDAKLCPHARDARTGLCRLSGDSQSRYMKVHDDSMAEQVGLMPSLRAMLNERMCTDVELRVPRASKPLPNKFGSLVPESPRSGASPLRAFSQTTCREIDRTITSLDSPTGNSNSLTTNRVSRRNRRSSTHSRSRRRRHGGPSVHDSSGTSASDMSIDDSNSGRDLNMSISSDDFSPRVRSPRSVPGSEISSDDESFPSPNNNNEEAAASPRLPSCSDRSRRSDPSTRGGDVISQLTSLDDADNGSYSSSTRHVRRAHKCILASRSPVFRAMFSLRMQENVKNEVDIEDLSPQVLDAFLDYIYSDTQPALHLVPGLLYAADKYQMPGLLHSCECVLVRSLTAENCLKVFQFANQHTLSCPHLRDNVMTFICKKFSEVSRAPQFLQFMKTHTSLAHDIVCQAAQLPCISGAVF